MKFTKPARTLAQQAAILTENGMLGDPARIALRLSRVNYYRLSAYWHAFRDASGRFEPNTHFDQVWDTYVFDRRLRLLVLDAIERLEVAVRSAVAYEHAQAGGPFGYLTTTAAVRQVPRHRKEPFIDTLRQDTDRQRKHSEFVQHFFRKYHQEQDLPIWMLTEVMTFGTLVSFFDLSIDTIKRAVSARFGVAPVVFKSWLLAVNTVRNICAHHGRLWNCGIGTQPTIPKRDSRPGSQTSDWHTPVAVHTPGYRLFPILTVLAHCAHKVAPNSSYARRVDALFAAHPTIPIHHMGFPPNWRDCPIWARMLAPTATPTATPAGPTAPTSPPSPTRP